MRRTLLLSGLVAATGAALAFGSYAALAGPGSGAAEDVLDGDGPGRGNEHAAVQVPAFDHAQDVDQGEASQQDNDEEGDDAELAQGEINGDEDGENGEGASKVAQAIADEFEVDVEDVLAFHDQDIGFGALFKLYALAEATGTDVQTLIDESSDGEGGHDFAFGEKWKDLTEEEQEALEEGPKNLGQLVSGANGPDGAGPAATGGPSGGEKPGNGSGPPPWAKAHGRR